MNILDTIIKSKQKEVAARKADVPVSELEDMPLFRKTCHSLVRSLQAPLATGIIAEFKRRSPSKGIINDQVSVESVGPVRNGLIKKGMIWSPAHGDTAFTVPMFDEFMRRVMPAWSAAETPKRSKSKR